MLIRLQIIFLWGKVGKYHFFFVSLQRNLKIDMSTFIGNIAGRCDEKGRIFVPAVYRRILSENGSKRVVMRRDTDNACLVFYPEEVWNGKVEALRGALNEWDPEDQMLLMQFMSDAEFMEMDGQGRILLSRRVLEMVGVEQEVLFVGMLDRFALWSPTQFESRKLEQKELAVRIRAKMMAGSAVADK